VEMRYRAIVDETMQATDAATLECTQRLCRSLSKRLLPDAD